MTLNSFLGVAQSMRRIVKRKTGKILYRDILRHPLLITKLFFNIAGIWSQMLFVTEPHVLDIFFCRNLYFPQMNFLP